MKVILFLLVVSATVVFLGCASTVPMPGHVFPGAIVDLTSYPVRLGMNEVYAAHPDSFTVIGTVEGSSGSINVLGLFSFGDAGYIDAVEDALTKVGGDGLVNCVADVKRSSFLFIFSSSKTIVRGLAIKRK